MQCAQFKVSLRLHNASFAAASWLTSVPSDYAAYLDFYGLSAALGQVQARFGWLEVAEQRLWVQAFRPDPALSLNTNKGTLLHLHGLYDHGASYPKFQAWALEQGWHYLTLDLLGHGLSSGARASVQDFKEYQLGVQALVAQLEELKMPRPWVLSGFSTGGAVALDFCLHSLKDQPANAQVDALLLIAPLVRPVGWRPHLVQILRLVRLFVRRLPRRFAANSNCQAYLDFVCRQDCLQGQSLSLDWILALAGWLQRLDKAASAPCPALVLQGDKDATLNWQYNLAALQQLLPQAQQVIITAAGHQLLNEAQEQQQQVLACLTSWLDSRVKPKQD